MSLEVGEWNRSHSLVKAETVIARSDWRLEFPWRVQSRRSESGNIERRRNISIHGVLQRCPSYRLSNL